MLADDVELMFAPTPITDTVVLLVQIVHTLGLLVFAGVVFSEVGVLRDRETPRLLRRIRIAAGISAIVCAPLLVVTEALRVSGREIDAITAPNAWAPAIWWQLAATGAVSVAGVCLAGAVLCLRRRALVHVDDDRAVTISTERRGRDVVALTNRGVDAWGIVAVLAAAAAASVPVLLGHTQSVHPHGLVQLVDVVHLLAGAFWVGGTCALALCYRAARVGEGSGEAAVTALITVRFSTIALATVIALVCAGGVLALLVLDSPAEIATTGWGRILVIKTVLVLCVGAAAAWNRWRLLPHVTRHLDAAAQWSALRTVVLIEAALLVVIVVVSGLLANADPHGHGALEAVAAVGSSVRS